MILTAHIEYRSGSTTLLPNQPDRNDRGWRYDDTARTLREYSPCPPPRATYGDCLLPNIVLPPNRDVFPENEGFKT